MKEYTATIKKARLQAKKASITVEDVEQSIKEMCFKEIESRLDVLEKLSQQAQDLDMGYK